MSHQITNKSRLGITQTRAVENGREVLSCSQEGKGRVGKCYVVPKRRGAWGQLADDAFR